jgi:hypothetical protein
LSVPDFVARLHYEADPPGKDDQHNDQFGVGTFHVAGIYHQITQIATGANTAAGKTDALLLNGACGAFTCAAGPAVHDHGWGVTGFLKFFVPMLPGTKLGAQRGSAADNIQLNANYCDGALEPCGIGGTAGNFNVGDAYWTGGLMQDPTDSRIINTGTGTFYNDKMKALVFNAQYHNTLTDCTDPIHCLTLTLEYNWAKVTPGQITQNTDWTNGGLGVTNAQNYTAELSWGVSRNGTTRPTWWRLDSEVQYRIVNATLPCNNNGVVGGGCGLATAVPFGITINPRSWVYRTTITFDW